MEQSHQEFILQMKLTHIKIWINRIEDIIFYQLDWEN